MCALSRSSACRDVDGGGVDCRGGVEDGGGGVTVTSGDLDLDLLLDLEADL